MTLKEYYRKEKHTRKERAWYKKTMMKKYEKYKEAYHEGKIKYRQRFSEKLTFSDFKKMYEAEYSISDKGTLKKFTNVEDMRELSDYSYRVKYENFLRNQDKYEKKSASGIPLSDAESRVVNYKFPKTDGEMPIEEIINLVNYFDKLGYSNIAFDSK